MSGTDPLFGIHAQALQLQQRRMEVLAANIANADTPGFQARDIDFRSALQQVMAQAEAARGNGQATPLPAVAADPLKFRVPMQPSVDGNTVDVQTEQAAFMDASLRYQAALGFVDGRIKSLLTAITGE